jgi:hypothetical protein
MVGRRESDADFSQAFTSDFFLANGIGNENIKKQSKVVGYKIDRIFRADS